MRVFQELFFTESLNEQACALAPVVNAAGHIAFDLEAVKEGTYVAETLNTDVATQLGHLDLLELAVL